MKKITLSFVLFAFSLTGFAQTDCYNLKINDNPQWTNMDQITWGIDFDYASTVNCNFPFPHVFNISQWTTHFGETTVTESGANYGHTVFIFPQQSLGFNLNEDTVFTCADIYGSSSTTGDILWSFEVCAQAKFNWSTQSWEIIDHSDMNTLSIGELSLNPNVYNDKCYDLLGREIVDLASYPVNSIYIKNGKKYLKTEE